MDFSRGVPWSGLGSGTIPPALLGLEDAVEQGDPSEGSYLIRGSEMVVAVRTERLGQDWGPTGERREENRENPTPQFLPPVAEWCFSRGERSEGGHAVTSFCDIGRRWGSSSLPLPGTHPPYAPLHTWGLLVPRPRLQGRLLAASQEPMVTTSEISSTAVPFEARATVPWLLGEATQPCR